MSIGSAALLPGTLPQAPLTPHPIARTRPFELVQQSWGATAPPRIFPLLRLADDPPRGRILVVEDDAEIALDLQRLLQDSGYLVIGPAVCTEDAERLIERRRGQPLTCAMIDQQMSGPSVLADHLARLNVPLIWLAAPAATPAAHSLSPVLTRPFSRNALRDALEEAVRQASGRERYATPPPQPVWPRVFPQL